MADNNLHVTERRLNQSLYPERFDTNVIKFDNPWNVRVNYTKNKHFYLFEINFNPPFSTS